MRLPLFARKGGRATGNTAEDFAHRYLRKQGLDIVARNYRTRRGEVDLIARAGELLIFVEVRLRNHGAFASGAESVDVRKQRRLVAAASAYLQETFGDKPPPCRFDVVSLASTADNRGGYDVDWLEDAFRAGE